MSVDGYLENWRCPECGSVTYMWHFTHQDGTWLTATVPSVPDFTSLAAAKQRAKEEHEGGVRP